MPAEPVTVEQPKYRLTQLTTYELRDYRRELERAIAFFDARDPVPPARDRLQASLDAVAFPGSPVQVTIQAEMTTIDSEIAERGGHLL